MGKGRIEGKDGGFEGQLGPEPGNWLGPKWQDKMLDRLPYPKHQEEHVSGADCRMVERCREGWAAPYLAGGVATGRMVTIRPVEGEGWVRAGQLREKLEALGIKLEDWEQAMRIRRELDDRLKSGEEVAWMVYKTDGAEAGWVWDKEAGLLKYEWRRPDEPSGRAEFGFDQRGELTTIDVDIEGVKNEPVTRQAKLQSGLEISRRAWSEGQKPEINVARRGAGEKETAEGKPGWKNAGGLEYKLENMGINEDGWENLKKVMTESMEAAAGMGQTAEFRGTADIGGHEFRFKWDNTKRRFILSWNGENGCNYGLKLKFREKPELEEITFLAGNGGRDEKKKQLGLALGWINQVKSENWEIKIKKKTGFVYGFPAQEPEMGQIRQRPDSSSIYPPNYSLN